MSVAHKPADLLTTEEYLEGERTSEVRHEFLFGRVYAMTGASDDHNRIAGNIFVELSNKLRGHRCEAFINDMKVRIRQPNSDLFYYPDVRVACDPADNAKFYRERPAVIFEVLSPETERIDQREKAMAYHQIPSVQIYLLVDQDKPRVTLMRRAESGWQMEVLEGRTAVLRIEALNVEIPFEHIYERTAVLKT